MKQMTLATMCMMAALATTPVMAASAEKPGDQRSAKNNECTYESTDKKRDTAKSRKGGRMDCIVVKGYPSQDGRATLRRSLEKEAKEGLGEALRTTLKDLLKLGPTS